MPARAVPVLLERDAILVLLEDLGVPVGKNAALSYSAERDARKEAQRALLAALADVDRAESHQRDVIAFVTNAVRGEGRS